MYKLIFIIILTLIAFYTYLTAININILYNKDRNILAFAYILIFYIIFNYIIYIMFYNIIFISKFWLFFNIICLIFIILKTVVFSYTPKKSQNIYNHVFMHRGFHCGVAENSVESFKLVAGKFGIEIDVRYLKKSDKLICFHDRYTSRLLGIPGKITSFSYNELRRFKIQNTKSRVTSFKKALEVINGKSALLIEIKGLLTNDYLLQLKRVLKNYNGEYYFHCKNIFTYLRLNDIYPGKVFWILNPFRKRFNFIKGKHYRNIFDVFKGFFEDASIEIPSLEDISQIIVNAIEGSDSVQEICSKMSRIMNKYTSRVNSSHWLIKSLKIHRGIISNKYPENSIDSIDASMKFAKYTDTLVSLELDLVYRNGEIICYHSDKVSNKLGQNQSCAEKLDIDDSITLREVLNLAIKKDINDLVSFIFDFKDFHMSNRILEKEFIKIIEETGYDGNFSVQSWNPLVLMYFEKIKPEYLRGQVGHSLSGLIKYVPLNGLPWVVNVLLFNLSHADYCVYDASSFIYVLIKYNKLKGRPVLIYAPKSEMEIESFIGKQQIEGFIIENALDPKSWSKSYIRKFKRVR